MANTTFTDRKGRTWDVALDLRTARQIDQSDFTEYYDKEFSILQLDRELITKLLTDAPFLFAVIWSMVQDQAAAKWKDYDAAKDHFDERASRPSSTVQADFVPPPNTFSVDPDEKDDAELEFVHGVNGPTIEKARDAFMEALADFFPDQRIALSILRRQSQAMSEKVGKKLEETIPLLNEVLDEEMEERVATLKEDLKKELKTGREKPNGGTSSQSRPLPGSHIRTSGSGASR